MENKQGCIVTLIQENETVIKVDKECDCGGRIVKYDKFTEEKYCDNCGWW